MFKQEKMFIITLALLAGMTLPAHAAAVNGQAAPPFTLKDTAGKNHALSKFKGKFVVLEWFNSDCPFVKKHYNSGNLPKLQKTYIEKGVVWLAINSSANGKEGYYPPAEAGAKMKESGGKPTALLLDSSGKVGKMYGAKTTPHIFIMNPQGVVIYQGAIDSIASMDSADIAKSQNYVQMALDEALAGKTVSVPTTKAYGCSVKY